MNGKDDHKFPLLRPPSRLDKLERVQAHMIDLVLALHALGMAKGNFTHGELEKMVSIVHDARPKLKEFNLDEGIKAIVTAFRIEVSGDEPKGGGK